MRFYVYSAGSPGYISAEVAVRELADEDEARAWASDVWSPTFGEPRFISRAEALMVPLYRDALERWECRDDAILQATEVAEIRAGRRAEAERNAALGCPAAIAALEADNDEAITETVMGHACERCAAWPEPGSRHLQLAS